MPQEDFVYVPVPAHLVSEVYALLVRLGAAPSGEAEADARPPVLDAELVKRMYFESEEHHRQLMRYLADHSDRWHYSGDLAEALNLTHGARSLAGMLGAFGRRAKHRYGGQRPWTSDWDPSREEARHMITFDTARYVNQAVAEDPSMNYPIDP